MARAAAEALTDEVAAILNEVMKSRALLCSSTTSMSWRTRTAPWLGDTFTKPGGSRRRPPNNRAKDSTCLTACAEVRLPPPTSPRLPSTWRLDRCARARTAICAARAQCAAGASPWGSAWLTDLLADPRVALRAEDLRDRLVGAQVDPEGRIARVVAEMVDRLKRRHVGLALRVASLTPECDASLLAKLREAAGASEVDVPQVMAEVEAFAFTEEYGPDHTWYVSVHPFVAPGLAQSFRRHYDEGLVRRLHEVAAEHYYAKIVTGSDYGEKFVYEDPVAQATLRSGSTTSVTQIQAAGRSAASPRSTSTPFAVGKLRPPRLLRQPPRRRPARGNRVRRPRTQDARRRSRPFQRPLPLSSEPEALLRPQVPVGC